MCAHASCWRLPFWRSRVRYGGEEFVALLPGTDREGAYNLAEKLRQAVSELTIAALDLRVTASFGVATYPADADDAEAVLRIADRALYSAKDKGRNRVEIAQQPGLEPALDSAAGAHSSRF